MSPEVTAAISGPHVVLGRRILPSRESAFLLSDQIVLRTGLLLRTFHLNKSKIINLLIRQIYLRMHENI